jgi:hypothetical protein
VGDDFSGTWVDVEVVDKDWVVVCHLCGVEARRVFPTACADDDNPRRRAVAYAEQHSTSSGHLAALDAYDGPLDAWVTPEELTAAHLLETSDHEVRLIAARHAAHRALGDQGP